MAIRVKGTKANSEQIRNMKTIIAVGKKMKAPPAVIQAALMTATQESTLRNLIEPVDHDSRGLFQQRPSQGWGTPGQVTTPSYAARKFYERAIPAFKSGTKDKTVLSQSVQRSAYPDAYRQWQSEAGQNLKTLSKGALSVSDGPGGDGNGNGSVDLERPEKPSEDSAFRDAILNRITSNSDEPIWQTLVNAKKQHDQEIASWKEADSMIDDLEATASTTDTDGGQAEALPGGKLNLAPRGSHAGTQGPLRSLYSWATQGVGGNVQITSEKRPNPSPVAGTNSDHYVGNKNAYAYDIAVPGHSTPTPQLDKVASRIVRVLSRLDPNAKETKNWGPKGGVRTFNVNGNRYQVIWRSQTGGNHNDHIHVGVRSTR